jgi:hypothetical protein
LATFAPYTVTDVVNLALKDAGIIGVGQTPNAEDSNGALTRLNWMLDKWAMKRWLVWHLKDYAVTSTGAQSYNVYKAEPSYLGVVPAGAVRRAPR